MSWVPPFFTCGICGGEAGRWPLKNLLKQDILDWRHRTVPATDARGRPVEPHRVVLGTPAAHIPLHRQTAEEAAEPLAVPPPEIPARPAMRHELPGAAVSLDKLAQEHGWRVEALLMRGPRVDSYWRSYTVLTSVVLRLDRDGHRLVVAWNDRGDKWEFDFAYSLTHYVAPLGGNELRGVVKHPRMICETCGEPPALHVLTSGGPVCHAEFLAAQSPDHGGTS